MKRIFLLIVACAFAFVGAQAQNSDVEATSQTTKIEQFKAACNFVKENILYTFEEGGLKIFAMQYTNLKTGEKIVGFEFFAATKAQQLTGTVESLGYLDIDQTDDFILALEKILEESANSDKGNNCAIHYTTNGGINVHYYYISGAMGMNTQVVGFRKRWLTTNEFGVQKYEYTQNPPSIGIAKLTKLISSLKEAQLIAKQSLGE